MDSSYNSNQQFDYLNMGNKSFESSNPIQLILVKMVRDMKFIGIITIISGVLNCLTVLGLPVGIPMIFMGTRLRESADFFMHYGMTNDQDFLLRAFEKQYRYFNIQKILFIISIIFFIIIMIVYVVLILAFISYNPEIFST